VLARFQTRWRHRYPIPVGEVLQGALLAGRSPLLTEYYLPDGTGETPRHDPGRHPPPPPRSAPDKPEEATSPFSEPLGGQACGPESEQPGVDLPRPSRAASWSPCCTAPILAWLGRGPKGWPWGRRGAALPGGRPRYPRRKISPGRAHSETAVQKCPALLGSLKAVS
jgi:hypothetical protein